MKIRFKEIFSGDLFELKGIVCRKMEHTGEYVECTEVSEGAPIESKEIKKINPGIFVKM